MMGAFAQFERALIRERQREGIAAAKAAGKSIGAPAKLTPDIKAAIKAKALTRITRTQLAADYGISRTTLYDVLKEEA